ncbi:hypothetical protein EYC80_008876 [Monilinia laxa]|uniref:HIRAN domain-containing protein n=1 Tax=Monilinia laxa TaxID=61186 RepID=A0A5N6K1P2_MONLA|nr:hypothetical protein EYC80_008876 [Monilinia laxa]
MEGPPAKRRRFFTENAEGFEPSEGEEATNVPDEINAPPPAIETSTSEIAEHDSHYDPVGEENIIAEDSQIFFSQETFENFIGDKVTHEVLKRLRAASGNDIERAVNMYFDGSWKQSTVVSGLSRSSSNSKGTVSSFMKPVNGGTANGSSRPASPQRIMPEYRYIGAFGVGGWATKSGTNLIRHGEVVRIERQKIQPPKTPAGRGRGKNSAVQTLPKPNSAAARRVDVIVRFTNSKGFEVGRLPRETANWVSTLIDQKICKFEGTCVYAPERIRTNDTVFLQLRCSLLRTAFDDRGFQAPDNRITGLFEERESPEEKDLRLRQVALVKLFEEKSTCFPRRRTKLPRNISDRGFLVPQRQLNIMKKMNLKALVRVALLPHRRKQKRGKSLNKINLTLYTAKPNPLISMPLRLSQQKVLRWI